MKKLPFVQINVRISTEQYTSIDSRVFSKLTPEGVFDSFSESMRDLIEKGLKLESLQKTKSEPNPDDIFTEANIFPFVKNKTEDQLRALKLAIEMELGSRVHQTYFVTRSQMK